MPLSVPVSVATCYYTCPSWERIATTQSGVRRFCITDARCLLAWLLWLRRIDRELVVLDFWGLEAYAHTHVSMYLPKATVQCTFQLSLCSHDSIWPWGQKQNE